MRLLGFNVGGTTCAAVVGTDDGTIVARKRWASHAERGPEPMIADLLSAASELAAAHGEPDAVGVAIGGPMNAKTGTLYDPPHLPGWTALPLADRLRKSLGVSVRVEHDAAACAFAEYLWGDNDGASDVAYVACGTGFGAGYIANGRIVHGAKGYSTELGHVRYADDGPTEFGKRGSAEAYCSANGLSGLAAWRFPSRWSAAPPTPAEVTALAAAGDLDATVVLAINARAVGEMCAVLADAMFPERMLLGSLARYAGEGWVDDVRRAFFAQVHPIVRKHCDLRAATLGADLQDLGALAAALGG